jgi:hypothetical protein
VNIPCLREIISSPAKAARREMERENAPRIFAPAGTAPEDKFDE